MNAKPPLPADIKAYLEAADPTKAAIRFQLSGEHFNEHTMVGTVDGYKIFCLRILLALVTSRGENGFLPIKLEDVIKYKDTDNDNDAGFDQFELSDTCGMDAEEFQAKASRPWPQWLGFTVGLAVMIFLVGLLYVFCQGVIATWHKLF